MAVFYPAPPYSSPADMPITIGSLYIAGFQQVGAPHAGLMVVGPDETEGAFVHIRAVTTAGKASWKYESKPQNINMSMSMSTLLQIHDVSAGVISPQELDNAARSVSVPSGGEGGECLNWVMKVVEVLHGKGMIKVSSLDSLKQEFSAFAAGNREYAMRTKLPNVKVSEFCI